MFTTTLPHNAETYREMKQLCSSWESVARQKIEDPVICEQESLFNRYVASKSVCEYSFYRFKKITKKTFQDYYIDIAYDSSLNITGFALSKIINVEGPGEPKRFLFLRYLTSNPEQFESVDRTKNLGNTILKGLQKRCVDEGLDGIFSEPVLSAMPYFKARRFTDASFQVTKRMGVVLLREFFD